MADLSITKSLLSVLWSPQSIHSFMRGLNWLIVSHAVRRCWTESPWRLLWVLAWYTWIPLKTWYSKFFVKENSCMFCSKNLYLSALWYKFRKATQIWFTK